MPKTQRNREKAEVAKDWVRFKFSPGLWENFLQKCIDSGKDVDETISQLISGWCWVLNQQPTEPGIQDKDQLEKEFAVLREDLNRRTLHYEKRDQLVRRARAIRKQLQVLGKAQ
jgi:hypothetical protein